MWNSLNVQKRLAKALESRQLTEVFSQDFLREYERLGGTDARLNEITHYLIYVFEKGTQCDMTHCTHFGDVAAVRCCNKERYKNKCEIYLKYRKRGEERETIKKKSDAIIEAITPVIGNDVVLLLCREKNEIESCLRMNNILSIGGMNVIVDAFIAVCVAKSIVSKSKNAHDMTRKMLDVYTFDDDLDILDLITSIQDMWNDFMLKALRLGDITHIATEVNDTFIEIKSSISVSALRKKLLPKVIISDMEYIHCCMSD